MSSWYGHSILSSETQTHFLFLLILKVTSYSKMAAGAPFIRSMFQAIIKRKGKKRTRVSASLIEPFQKSHRTLLIMFLWSSFYRMATSRCKEGWEVPLFSQVYCPGFTKEEGEDGCKLYAESKRPGNKNNTYCIILLI